MKPSFYSDEELNDLPLEAHFLFGGLFGMADVAGRLEDRPRTIKVNVFPLRDVDVEPLLALLAKPKANGRPFIYRYEVGGVRVIQIATFTVHQRIMGREADTESTLPPPPGKDWKEPENSGITQVKPNLSRKGREGKGKEGKGYSAADIAATPIPEDLQSSRSEILDWLTFKREKGQTYKGTKGLEALWRMVRAIPEGQRRAAVDHSMANNYTGLFAPKGGSNATPRNGFRSGGTSEQERKPDFTGVVL